MSGWFELLPEIAVAVLAWLATWALHAAVALVVILLGLRVTRAGDAVRDIAWRAALVAPLVTATLQSAAGLGSIDLRLPWRAPPVVAAVSEAAPVRGSDVQDPLVAAPGSGTMGPVPMDAARQPVAPPEAVAPRREAVPALEPDGDAAAARTVFDAGVAEGDRWGPRVADGDPASGSAIGPASAPGRHDALAYESVETMGQPERQGFPGVAENGPVQLESGADPATAAPRPIPALAWLALLPALAALVGLARLGLLRIQLQRLLDDRGPVTDPDLLAAAGRLAECAGLRAAPRLTVTDRLTSPVALGVLRPEICVPRRALDGLNAAARDAMLAHEIAHHIRRDPLWLELAHALSALLPWHPLPHLARRRLAVVAEYRCDALAAGLAGAVPLAECMVEVASWSLSSGSGAGARPMPLGVVAGMAFGRSGLEARVDRVLADGAVAPLAPRRTTTAGVLVLALLGGTQSLPAVRPVGTAAERASGDAVTVPAGGDPRVSSVAPVTPLDLSAAVAAERIPATSPLAAPADSAPADSALADAATDAELVAQLPTLLEVVAAEHELLVLQVEALRAELAPADLADPEIQALLVGLQDQLAALGSRREALGLAAQDFLKVGEGPTTAARR